MSAERSRWVVAGHVAGVFTVVAVLVAHVVPLAPPSGDVRHLIAAYLADANAARDDYRGVRFTATGTVNWSHRTLDITTRAIDDGDERSPHLERAARTATVYITLPGGHRVLADFEPERQAEALALKPGDRVTITGRHNGSWINASVYLGKFVYLSLFECEIAR